MNDLDNFRKQIDDLDQQILALLDERMRTSIAIGLVKRATNAMVFDAGREFAVFDNLLAGTLNKRIPEWAVLDIFSEIIKVSRALQSDNLQQAPPKLYAVLGHPIGHSLSPVMHNRAFSFINHNGLYFALDTTDVGRTLFALKDLDFGGASITMPHKETIVDYLDELIGVAKEMRVVNTVVFTNGKLVGYNTDSEGAMLSLKYRTELEGKTVLLLGAGGAARSIAYGLKMEKVTTFIANRDEEKGRKLAELTGAVFVPLDEALGVACDIIINATSVGMHPNADDMPVPPEIFQENMLVMDIVYNPLHTKFIKEAVARGCVPVDGVSMFVQQGARQFELWTSKAAPLPIMRQTVLSLLKTNE